MSLIVMLHKKLSQEEISQLNESLHYCKVQELKEICQKLCISDKGKKPDLIESVTQFVESGIVPIKKKIPLSSCKKVGQEYPLHPETRMVYGAFKNDLVTRLFFKKLIGNHFYYTVFGLDWLKKQWSAGTPPTYAEFATFWQNEYLRRKGKQQELKPEWAYLNFMRTMKEHYPDVSKAILLDEWEKVRLQHKNNVIRLLFKKDNE